MKGMATRTGLCIAALAALSAASCPLSDEVVDTKVINLLNSTIAKLTPEFKAYASKHQNAKEAAEMLSWPDLWASTHESKYARLFMNAYRVFVTNDPNKSELNKKASLALADATTKTLDMWAKER